MHRDDLERLIGEKLAALPRPAAPPTLWPRVRDAVEAHLARPWRRRAWRTWPAPARAASLGLLAAAFLGLTLLEPTAQGLWSQVLGTVQGAGGSAATFGRGLLAATEVIRRTLVEPIVVYVLALVLMTGASATVLGIALERLVAMEGVSES